MHGTGNPVRTAALPKKMPVTERKEPTREQQELIEAHPEGCGFWAALFEYTGMRIGEANGLRWRDVDFEKGRIYPSQAMPWERNQPYEEELKTEKAYRAIPILARLRPLLEKRGLKASKAYKISRGISLVFAFIFAAFIVYAFFSMLVPQLYESVMNIVDNASTCLLYTSPSPRD